MRPVLAALVAAFLCSCAMTPHECRTVGVYVPDGAEQTGEIVEEHDETIAELSARCGSPFRELRGCAQPVGANQWVIRWSDGYSRDHERCHALYETAAHIDRHGNVQNGRPILTKRRSQNES